MVRQLRVVHHPGTSESRDLNTYLGRPSEYQQGYLGDDPRLKPHRASRTPARTWTSNVEIQVLGRLGDSELRVVGDESPSLTDLQFQVFMATIFEEQWLTIRRLWQLDQYAEIRFSLMEVHGRHMSDHVMRGPSLRQVAKFLPPTPSGKLHDPKAVSDTLERALVNLELIPRRSDIMDRRRDTSQFYFVAFQAFFRAINRMCQEYALRPAIRRALQPSLNLGTSE